MEDLINFLETRHSVRSYTSQKIEDEKRVIIIDLINEINQISDAFQHFDSRRDEIQEQLKSTEIKPFFDRLSMLRTKLLKCKVENQVISNYVNVTREFISEVVNKALPQTRNKNYTKYGTITQPQTASVLVDVRG